MVPCSGRRSSAIIFQLMQRALELWLYPRRNLPVLLSTLIWRDHRDHPGHRRRRIAGQRGVQALPADAGPQVRHIGALSSSCVPICRPGSSTGCRRSGRLRRPAREAERRDDAGSQLVAGQALSIGQGTCCTSSSAPGSCSSAVLPVPRRAADRPEYRRDRDAAQQTPQPALLDRFTAVVRDGARQHHHRGDPGMIGGITFWLLGTEGALWGVLMAFMAMVPTRSARRSSRRRPQATC